MDVLKSYVHRPNWYAHLFETIQQVIEMVRGQREFCRLNIVGGEVEGTKRKSRSQSTRGRGCGDRALVCRYVSW